VLLASEDSSLRAVLRSTLRDDGYNVHEVAAVEAARSRIEAADPPALVLADAQLGAPLWRLCADQAAAQRGPAIVVLAYDEKDLTRAQAAGAAMYLQLPLPLAEIVACVGQLTRAGDLEADAQEHANALGGSIAYSEE
jgi:DNA-binding response OmpR family regulator